MESNPVQLEAECPSYDIEEVQIKNEPLDVLSENEEEIEEAYNESFEEDLEVEKDVDPFHFLKLHYTSEEITRMNESADMNQSYLDAIAAGNVSFTHSGKRKNHTCHICFKEYVDLKSIRRHLLRIHAIEPPQGTALYECPDCFEKFSDKSHLNRHLLKHTGVKPHVCLKCNKGFGRKEHLTRHQLKVKCDQVKEKPKNDKKKMKTEVSESKDIESVAPVPVKRKPEKEKKGAENGVNVSQSWIDENQASSEFLTILKVESVRTEFPQCTLCAKKFVHLSHLRVHMKTHNIPPTKFECPICGKNLSRKDHLNHHIKKLHGTNNVAESNAENSISGDYACNLCPKTFTDSAAYEKHLAMHSNNQLKKEVCDICNHIFLSKWHVRKHKLHKHNIEPENGCLACVFCEKKFIDNYYLKRHYMTKHKNEPFPFDNPFAIVTKGSRPDENSSAAVPTPVFLKQEQPEQEQFNEEHLEETSF